MTGRMVILITQRTVHAAHLTKRQKRWVIAQRAITPCDAPCTICDDTDLVGLTEPIAQAVRECMPGHPEIDLIVPASWCLVHRLALGGRKVTDQAVEFALEEFVPAPIAEFTLAWQAIDANNVWAVAVPTAPLRQLVDALAASNVEVRRILVDAQVAWTMIGGRCSGIIIRDGPRFTSVTECEVRSVLCEGRLLETHRMISSAAAELDADDWSMVEFDSSMGREAGELPGQPLTTDSLMLAAVEATQPDLRVGLLASVHLFAKVIQHGSRAAILAALLLSVLIIRDLVSSRRLQSDLDRLRALQINAFSEVFPDRSLPTAPALVLASERKRLSALTQTPAIHHESGDTDDDRIALLGDLARFVAGLPDDLRIRLTEINLDGQQISLRGRTTDHREAERVAEALRRVPGVDCGLPRTSRLPDGGVEFSLRGKRAKIGLDHRVAKGD